MSALVETFGQWALGGSAAGGGFAIVRFALNWMAGRADRREARLDAQEESIDQQWKGIRLTLGQRVERLELQLAAMRRAYQRVTMGLMRRDPQAAELIEAEQIMAKAFPLDFDVLTARAEDALDRENLRTGGTA